MKSMRALPPVPASARKTTAPDATSVTAEMRAEIEEALLPGTPAAAAAAAAMASSSAARVAAVLAEAASTPESTIAPDMAAVPGEAEADAEAAEAVAVREGGAAVALALTAAGKGRRTSPLTSFSSMMHSTDTTPRACALAVLRKSR